MPPQSSASGSERVRHFDERCRLMPRSCSIASCRNIDAMTDLPNRIIDHYERQAADWDRDRQNAAWKTTSPGTTAFIESLAAGAAVLDLGCGSGRPVAVYELRPRTTYAKIRL